MCSANISAELEREYWGILTFETNLWNLYQYLDLDMEMDFSRFADYVCFPDKMPSYLQDEVHHRLSQRVQDETYQDFLEEPIPSNLVIYENIVKEVIYLKNVKDDANIHYLQYLFSLAPQSFFAFLTQLVERGHLTSATVVQITSRYFEEQSNERTSENEQET